jgi:hypothetical protein
MRETGTGQQVAQLHDRYMMMMMMMMMNAICIRMNRLILLPYRALKTNFRTQWRENFVLVAKENVFSLEVELHAFIDIDIFVNCNWVYTR